MSTIKGACGPEADGWWRRPEPGAREVPLRRIRRTADRRRDPVSCRLRGAGRDGTQGGRRQTCRANSTQWQGHGRDLPRMPDQPGWRDCRRRRRRTGRRILQAAGSAPSLLPGGRRACLARPLNFQHRAKTQPRTRCAPLRRVARERRPASNLHPAGERLRARRDQTDGNPHAGSRQPRRRDRLRGIDFRRRCNGGFQTRNAGESRRNGLSCLQGNLRSRAQPEVRRTTIQTDRMDVRGDAHAGGGSDRFPPWRRGRTRRLTQKTRLHRRFRGGRARIGARRLRRLPRP